MRIARTLTLILALLTAAAVVGTRPADAAQTFGQWVERFWPVAKAAEVPHIAWNFHQRCPPNLLQDTAADGCGLSPSTGYDFPRTSWGNLLHDYLATAW